MRASSKNTSLLHRIQYALRWSGTTPVTSKSTNIYTVSRKCVTVISHSIGTKLSGTTPITSKYIIHKRVSSKYISQSICTKIIRSYPYNSQVHYHIRVSSKYVTVISITFHGHLNYQELPLYWSSTLTYIWASSKYIIIASHSICSKIIRMGEWGRLLFFCVFFF